MNVSTPPKHPWQPQRYEHVEPDPLTRLAIQLGNALTAGRIVALSLENQTLRGKLTLFDDSHAHVVNEIKMRSTGTPPRMSCTLDGIEVAHLLSNDIPITCDSTLPCWNIVTLPFICRKYSSQ